MIDTSVHTITDEELVENVKHINKIVKKANEYLQEHSKEVYKINFTPIGYKLKKCTIEIYFDADDTRLRKAQEQINIEQSKCRE